MFRLLKLIPRPSHTLHSHFLRLESSLSDYQIQHEKERVIKADVIPMALYGGRNTVTLIPGAGIGPECLNHVRTVFRYVGAPVDFETVDINAAKDQEAEFDYAIMSVKRNGVGIKGNIDKKTTENLGVTLKNVALRNDLDLYVYVIHCKSYPGIRAKFSDIDIIVIRQNTGGEYAMLEHNVIQKFLESEHTNNVVESLKIMTRPSILRLARYAFEYAKKNGRKKITTVHKANIMKFSDGLFLECSNEIAKEYPEIKHENIIVDNCCMQLVKHPQQFDVLLTSNLYGNIVASVISGLCGGPGLMSGVNYGDHYAIFETGNRNSAEEIVGQNIANPVAMLTASVDMLYHLGHEQHATKIKNAIWKTLTQDKIHTSDIGGTATSQDMVTNIIDSCLNT